MGVLMRRCAAVAAIVLVVTGADGPYGQNFRNAGKYGAMFSWWYEGLLPQTTYLPTIPWDARQPAWWTSVVREARDAGLGWIAAASWGEGTTADPVLLGPLLPAIERNGGGLKVALFDDTTSEVLRKNEARGHGWTLDVPFDLGDLQGTGEGGLRFFYDQQWKRFFSTIPDRYRLKLEGRPVVFMWHSHSGGLLRYARAQEFHAFLQRLREATERDFGVNPFVIVEERWMQLDPLTEPDAIYAWFDAPGVPATSRLYKGVRVAQVVPGYDCSTCPTPGPRIDRQGGALYRAALQTVSPAADLVLIEGLVNVDENAHLVETTAWGRQYLDTTRWFSMNVP
jgi:hypothetical protein